MLPAFAPLSDGTVNRKYGCYDEDAAILTWLREGHTDNRKCIEAQVMDWSDDIAYSVHDVEDGVLSGRLDLRALSSPAEVRSLSGFGASSFRGAEAAELGTTPRGEWKHYRRVEAGEVAGAVVDGHPVGGWLVDVAAVLADRASGVAFTRELLARTAARAPRLGCFGLHEWAMAYRSDVHGVRHSQLPLRLGAEGTDAVVEGSRIRCTHFDAFRFFAPEARDRNEGDDGVLPTRAGMREMEQPGCLHAGMDLYKWAYKLVPVVDSDLLADCFDLAWDIRRLDMEASPYDLTGVDDLSDGRGGYAAVRIEEPAGRAEYARRQREFAERGQALRARLLAVLDEAAGAAPGPGRTPSGLPARVHDYDGFHTGCEAHHSRHPVTAPALSAPNDSRT